MKTKTAMWPVVVVCLGIVVALGIVARAVEEDDDIAEHFSLMDRNDNDLLSSEEFRQAQEMAQEVLLVDFTSADEDEDGTLSIEEYQTYLSNIGTSSSGADAEEGDLDEDALEALADILRASASTESDTAEIKQLLEDLEEAGETDAVAYVLSHPTAYSYSYRTLGVWAKRYPGRLKWANTIRAHHRAGPTRPGSATGPGKKTLPPNKPPRPARPSGAARPSGPVRPAGRPSGAPRPARH